MSFITKEPGIRISDPSVSLVTDGSSLSPGSFGFAQFLQLLTLHWYAHNERWKTALDDQRVSNSLSQTVFWMRSIRSCEANSGIHNFSKITYLFGSTQFLRLWALRQRALVSVATLHMEQERPQMQGCHSLGSNRVISYCTGRSRAPQAGSLTRLSRASLPGKVFIFFPSHPTDHLYSSSNHHPPRRTMYMF